MKLSADLQAFEARIGYQFRNPELLVRAVTHASISSTTRPDNQRLEFLGDRVLGLVMAETLLEADKTAAEGKLAPGSTRWCARKPAPMWRGRWIWAMC